ncbi:MAG: ATP-binding protein [Euryarchaeota archaeon]|nr:ATP-binding protein [Euryarchaeota archaeon]
MVETLGVCIGEATPSHASFIARTMPKLGEYVVLHFDGMRVLGMVESVSRGSASISGDILSPEVVERILSFEGEEQYIKAKVRLLGEVGSLTMPRIPPPPGARVHRADAETLREIFGRGNIKLGRLLTHPEVEVYVDANRMITRHLAILAITGAGKSNTVSVIVEGLLKLSGMPVIFDMHSEYVNAEFSGGVKRILPRLNPVYLLYGELKRLVNIDEKAYIQERYLREAHSHALELVQTSPASLVDEMLSYLEEVYRSEDIPASEKNSISGVIGKLMDFREKYGDILDEHAPELVEQFEQGRANVIDLGSVDEEYADVIVSHVLRKLLHRRKQRQIAPAFCILEEAHILAPAYRPTLSKYWIDRIAREGRKFGIGLCLVSQRPKSLDPNSLSQANNAIIMRLVEPSDQRHVQQASERLSDDLLAQLSSLNIGEAVVLGLMTRIPALVKIDRFEGKLSGGDPDIVEEWQERMRGEEDELERASREVEELYSGME